MKVCKFWLQIAAPILQTKIEFYQLTLTGDKGIQIGKTT